jgi:hypothetical protein
MLKVVVVTLVAAFPLCFVSTGNLRATSHADQISGGKTPAGLISCPAGTCGSKGFPRAKGLKGCKASNCPK